MGKRSGKRVGLLGRVREWEVRRVGMMNGVDGWKGNIRSRSGDCGDRILPGNHDTVHLVRLGCYESVIQPWLASVTMLYAWLAGFLLFDIISKKGLDIPGIFLECPLLILQPRLLPLFSPALHFLLVDH